MHTRILFFTSALVLSLAASLSGCAMTSRIVNQTTMYWRDYTEPEEGSQNAFARFSTSGVLRLTPNSSCANLSDKNGGVAIFALYSLKDYSYLHGKRRGVPGVEPPNLTSTELRIQGGEPIFISYTDNWGSGGGQYTCSINKIFHPAIKGRYQVTAQRMINERSCLLFVYDIEHPQELLPTTEAPACPD